MPLQSPCKAYVWAHVAQSIVISTLPVLLVIPQTSQQDVRVSNSKTAAMQVRNDRQWYSIKLV